MRENLKKKIQELRDDITQLDREKWAICENAEVGHIPFGTSYKAKLFDLDTKIKANADEIIWLINILHTATTDGEILVKLLTRDNHEAAN